MRAGEIYVLDNDEVLPQVEKVADEELEKKRREYVFCQPPRLKPARIDDLRGMSHIVEEIKKFIAFLRDYQKFKNLGVRIQPGILLYGPPGTGKTLTARVIATESGVKLIDAGGFPKGGSNWTAGDIHSLFSLARELHAQTMKPVIIYFDEFDTVCPRVRRYMSEASAALMAELDGIGGKPEGIFVVAAANSLDVDRALLRAGRLGYQINYHPPPWTGKRDILQYYLEKKPHGPIDVEGLAKIMPEDMTPAEIEELVEQAYVDASLSLPEARLTEAALITQLLTSVLGPKHSAWPSESERYRACVHEAGHVIAGELLGCSAKLVVVLKNGYDRGATLFVSSEENSP
ncbi:MAG: ATP-binding protein, partial [Candidatus Hadarchaeales archaeon]